MEIECVRPILEIILIRQLFTLKKKKKNIFTNNKILPDFQNAVISIGH